jgi:pilus assembly protein Flp/PilA
VHYALRANALFVSAHHQLEDSMTEVLRKLWNDDQGQDIAEYALMLAVILVVVIGAVVLIGQNANTIFGKAATALTTP